MPSAYSTALSLILRLPAGVPAAQPPRPDARGALTVLCLGVVGSALSRFTWAKALSPFPAGTCSLRYPPQAAFSALLGAVILNERFTAAFFIGLALSPPTLRSARWRRHARQKRPNDIRSSKNF